MTGIKKMALNTALPRIFWLSMIAMNSAKMTVAGMLMARSFSVVTSVLTKSGSSNSAAE